MAWVEGDVEGRDRNQQEVTDTWLKHRRVSPVPHSRQRQETCTQRGCCKDRNTGQGRARLSPGLAQGAPMQPSAILPGEGPGRWGISIPTGEGSSIPVGQQSGDQHPYETGGNSIPMGQFGDQNSCGTGQDQHPCGMAGTSISIGQHPHPGQFGDHHPFPVGQLEDHHPYRTTWGPSPLQDNLGTTTPT